MNDKAFMSWSGGKDSALALYKAQQSGVPVNTLVTTVNQSLNRVSMHGVRRELLQRQATSLHLPLTTIELPEVPDMQVYEEAVRQTNRNLKSSGITQGVFGDIFLEDLKQYRESLLEKDGLQCLFPLWGLRSDEVVKQFLEAGFKAVVVCVNSAFLSEEFCGRLLDETFFNDLPSSVDLCGENGEYHSFVFDGPNFSDTVLYEKGERVFKEYPSPKQGDDCFTQPQPLSGFYFCDLLPV
jgi:uncharacterized protein (TIGR00290 family)